MSKNKKFIGKGDSNATWNVVDEELIAYNSRQYEEMYRSTNFVISNLSEKIKKNDSLNVLDVGTGGGANLYHVANHFQNCRFLGVDINKFFINYAKEKHRKHNMTNVNFIDCDILCEASIEKLKKTKYDLVGSSQVVSFLNYEVAKKVFHRYFEISNKAVYFQSLFTENKLDFQINIYDYIYNKIVPYNIYSIPNLVKIANSHNFKLLTKRRFDIDIDLYNNTLGRGTKTIKNEDGQRMMFSGDLYLPWHFLYFEKG